MWKKEIMKWRGSSNVSDSSNEKEVMRNVWAMKNEYEQCLYII